MLLQAECNKTEEDAASIVIQTPALKAEIIMHHQIVVVVVVVNLVMFQIK